jgi:hypothetical protein
MLLREQIAGLEAERRALLRSSQEATLEKVRQLMPLKGIGINGAWLFVMEFFGGGRHSVPLTGHPDPATVAQSAHAALPLSRIASILAAWRYWPRNGAREPGE